MSYNNSHLNYFDYATHSVYADDIYYAQNTQNIGDTGQDLIAYNDCLYLSVYGSNYIAKLNTYGVELNRVSFVDTAVGAVRYLAASKAYLYVSSYDDNGVGYVTKVNAETLDIVASVTVGSYPYQVLVSDGYIYCINSGWGADNTMSIISESTFTVTESVEVIYNGAMLAAVGDKIAIQGYGSYYDYPVVIYDKTAKTYTQIGTGSNIAANGNTLYVLNTQTDYSNWPEVSSVTDVYTYNATTSTITENVLAIPDEMYDYSSTYGIAVNEATGYVYILATNYSYSDGAVFYFDANGNYLGNFASGGQNPSKIVFVND